MLLGELYDRLHYFFTHADDVRNKLLDLPEIHENPNETISYLLEDQDLKQLWLELQSSTGARNFDQ